MKKKRYTITTGYFIVFVITVLFLAVMSFIKLVNYYVNDVVDYNEWNADLGNRFETNIATTFFEKYEFININGAIRNILGQHDMNGVIKLNNGYLTVTYEECDDNTLMRYAEDVKRLDECLSDMGISLLYVQSPNSVSKYDEELPRGVYDFGNKNTDIFVQDLKSCNVDVIDIRECMEEDGISLYDMMYVTDHHWTMPGGFYGYTKISERIDEVLGCNTNSDIKNINNYTVETYPKWHLGSYGQRTGMYYARIDDFELLVPQFDTMVSDNESKGTFEEMLISREALENKDYKSRYTYDSVLGKSISEFTNNICNNDKKIMLITDSFGKAVAPFLAITYKGLKCVTMQEAKELTKEDIENYSPDMVVILYHTKYLQENYDNTFSFANIK